MRQDPHGHVGLRLPREAFEASLGFPLDPFQRKALDALDSNRSVLVAAPTGSGKTVIAEHAIARALALGKKAFYTTPLKALSNQKYGDLVRVHGAHKVGLLTGDNSINGEAPIVVMTTEVLRNMVYAGSSTLEDLRYVILDEVHYLQNRYRGAVWEEVIIHLPPEVDLVCLSATVSNAEELAEWLGTVRGETQAIIEERRPVDLDHLYCVGDRSSEDVHLLPTFVRHADGSLTPNQEAARLDQRSNRGVARPGWRGRPTGSGRGLLYTPRRVEVVERLDEEAMLPAIYFIFSRAACDDAVRQCLAANVRLTEPPERERIRAIAESKVEGLSDQDLRVLGYGEWLAGLEAGIASHHAGLVPPMKEAVEEAFTAGLVKVVFATETLSLGINMPARSVVIEKLSKFNGERHELLTSGEYTQLTGRAGRRGIDEIGYAVVLWNPFTPFDQIAGLASNRTYVLTSSFRPTYNMAANLVMHFRPDTARHLLNLSFAQFRADRDVVRQERRLAQQVEALGRARDEAVCDRGDIEEYRRLLREMQGANDVHGSSEVAANERGSGRSGAGGGEREGGGVSIARLRPGDVLSMGKRGGRVVVLQLIHERGGAAKVMALTLQRQVVRLGQRDFRGPVVVAGRIALPRPFAPRSLTFRRAASEALRRARLQPESGGAGEDVGKVGDGTSRRGTRAYRARLERELERHPVASCPKLRDHLRSGARIDRLADEVDRIERSIRGRTESLARQFDRVLRVLEAWQYVDDWDLSDSGILLARLYAETDLLIADALVSGTLDGLEPAALSALVSCFTYERRGSDRAPAPRVHWPNRDLASRYAKIDQRWQRLASMEDEAGLPETRAPDPGFCEYAFSWAKGGDLEDLLDTDEFTGGDFVRNVKQLIDLLRQIGEVAPQAATAEAARRGADALFRGVVASSSVVSVGGPE